MVADHQGGWHHHAARNAALTSSRLSGRATAPDTAEGLAAVPVARQTMGPNVRLPHGVTIGERVSAIGVREYQRVGRKACIVRDASITELATHVVLNMRGAGTVRPDCG